jgi:intracellular multiplication protein IcmC
MAPNIFAMLESLAEQLPSLITLVKVFAYLAGLIFIGSALYKLRSFGDFRMMMHGGGSDLKGAFGAITFGTFLIWLPRTLETVSATFWGVTEPIGYEPGGASLYDQGIAVCMEIVAFVGLIAFVRGLIIMGKLGQQGQQPNMFGKAMTHMIGGILAYHLGATIDVIKGTLAL